MLYWICNEIYAKLRNTLLNYESHAGGSCRDYEGKELWSKHPHKRPEMITMLCVTMLYG